MSKPNPLIDEPFSYRASRGDRVQIFHHGRLAVTLAGQKALKFLLRVESADVHTAQLAMAKATGQFKFGNEREDKRRRGR